MNINKFFTLAVSALAVAWLAGTPVFAQVPELEPNHPIDSAQSLTDAIPTTGSFSVMGALTSDCTMDAPCPLPSYEGDLDFYSFSGAAGQVVTIDIDNGWGGMQPVNTVIALFGPGPLYPMLVLNDDNLNPLLDPGSTSTLDSMIENYELTASGVYTVGVSNYPRLFRDGGTVINLDDTLNGDYTLVLSITAPAPPAPPPSLSVNIDIKPGTDNNMINLLSMTRIPVAVLSTPLFFAPTAVATSTLTFGRTGGENSLVSCSAPEDTNGDGLLDTLCYFDSQASGFQVGDQMGHLQGQTTSGQDMVGSDTVEVKEPTPVVAPTRPITPPGKPLEPPRGRRLDTPGRGR